MTNTDDDEATSERQGVLAELLTLGAARMADLRHGGPLWAELLDSCPDGHPPVGQTLEHWLSSRQPRLDEASITKLRALAAGPAGGPL